jgi:hypothetical protein
MYQSKIDHPYKDGVVVNVNGFKQTDMFYDGSLISRYLLEYWTKPILYHREACGNPTYIKSTHLMPKIRVYIQSPDEFESDGFVEERFIKWDDMTLNNKKDLSYVFPCSKKRTIVNHRCIEEKYEIGDTSDLWGYIQSIYSLEPSWGAQNPINQLNLSMVKGNSLDKANEDLDKLKDSLVVKDTSIYFNIPIYMRGRMTTGYRPDVYPQIGPDTIPETNTIGYENLAVAQYDNLDKLNLDKLSPNQLNSITTV